MNYCMRNSMVGVSGMGWRSRRANNRVLACLAVFGVGGIAGLAAAISAGPVQTSGPSPAEIVALRFPGGASQTTAIHVVAEAIASNDTVSNDIVQRSASAEAGPSPAASGYMLASAAESDASSLMFSPFPTYSSAAYSSARSSPVASSAASSSPPYAPPAAAPRLPAAAAKLPAELVTASLELPTEALGYAAPGADEPPAPAVSPARPENASAGSAPAKRPVQAPHPAAPASASNAVLNNAQIASIKERLKLSSYQNQLWPPVESALRDISYQGHADAGGRKLASGGLVSGGHGATIDPNSAPVQRLKSAAFPLLMSLSEDQKQEVRTMVRLMGLENLASQF
jgi:hypothetical protein